MKLSNKQNSVFFWPFILVIVLAGLYFRLKGLGKWSLAVDEYYIVKSSENILKYGLPQWDAGGYYIRGLPQLYLTALLLSVGIKAEFASRIIPVIANLLAIPGLYLLAKKVSGRMLGAAIIFIFTFSVWEVEFARFARMYTLFQTIFVWYLYFLYKTIIENDDRAFKWLWILSFLSIFIYEGSIFLVILNFLPIIWDKHKNIINPFSFEIYKAKILKIVISIGIFLIAYGLLTFNFRTLNQSNLLPPDVVDYFKTFKSEGLLRKPVLLLQTLPSNLLWLLLLIIPLAVNIFTFYKIKKSDSTIFYKTAFTVMLIFSFLNLVGLLIISTLIFFLMGWLNPQNIKLFQRRQLARRNFSEGGLTVGSNRSAIGNILPSNIFRSFLFAGVINFIFWIVFALNTNTWYNFFRVDLVSTKSLALKTIVKESINYPYIYETYALFRDTIPITTIIILFLLSFLIVYIFMNYYKKGVFHYRFLLFLLLFLVLAQNILNLTYFETRYFFFLYPLILLVILSSLERIMNLISTKYYLSKFAFGLSLVVVLIFSEDFRANHLLNIDSEEINFRMNFSLPLTEHYYPRWDIETPANVVDRESNKDDVIITNEQICRYYLNRLDYTFKDFKGPDFQGESILNGTKERWTYAKLIYKYSDLNQMIDNSHHRIWLMINTMWALDELDSVITKYQKYLYFTSIDGHILLYKVTK